MHIAKVIKVYFIFLMTVGSIAAVSYNDTVENYIVSVFHSTNTIAKIGVSSSFKAPTVRTLDESRRVFISHNENSNLVNFTIVNNPAEAFAAPGAEHVRMMDFVFKTSDEDLLLEDLNLKIMGIEPENIEKALLASGEEIIKNAQRSNEYLLFSNINYKIEAGTEQKLSLYVDLGLNLHTGQRLRMDIEKPDDIRLIAGNKPYVINQYYPIKGKYLSIAKNRPWGLKKDKKDEVL